MRRTNKQDFDRHKSKFRLVIWPHDGSCKVFYSFLPVEKKKGQAVALQQLENMIVGKWKGRYNTAIIYTNDGGKSGKQIIKYVADQLQFDNRNHFINA